MMNDTDLRALAFTELDWKLMENALLKYFVEHATNENKTYVRLGLRAKRIADSIAVAMDNYNDNPWEAA